MLLPIFGLPQWNGQLQVLGKFALKLRGLQPERPFVYIKHVRDVPFTFTLEHPRRSRTLGTLEGGILTMVRSTTILLIILGR
jgi:hypothetical protein